MYRRCFVARPARPTGYCSLVRPESTPAGFGVFAGDANAENRGARNLTPITIKSGRLACELAQFTSRNFQDISVTTVVGTRNEVIVIQLPRLARTRYNIFTRFLANCSVSAARRVARPPCRDKCYGERHAGLRRCNNDDDGRNARPRKCLGGTRRTINRLFVIEHPPPRYRSESGPRRLWRARSEINYNPLNPFAGAPSFWPARSRPPPNRVPPPAQRNASERAWSPTNYVLSPGHGLKCI
jgi:hypothetical protein